MQQYPKNPILRERITLIRRPKSRNVLKMPILTVHNQQKDRYQVDSKSQLKMIFCERFKEKNNNKNAISIVEKMPVVEYSYLKNTNSKKEIDMSKNELLSKFKTHYRNLTDRLLSNLREETVCERDQDETYQNRVKQRLLKKFSKNKNHGQQNLSLILMRRLLPVLKCSLNTRKILEQGDLRQTLSCRVIPYHHSNISAKNDLKKELISRRALQKEESKDYNSLYQALEKRTKKTIYEEQLGGWQTNMLNKTGQEFNVCSFNSQQL